MASRGEGINAGLRSVKCRHLVMRMTFIRRRDLTMCRFFYFFLLTHWAEETLCFPTRKITPQYCFVFCLPWFKTFTTLCQGVSEVRFIGFFER